MTEPRLYVVTLLAGVYSVSWLAIARPSTAPSPLPDEPPPPAWTAPTESVAPAAAPVIAVPRGWRVVTPSELAGGLPAGTAPSVRAPAQRTVRAPAPRPVRVPARRVRTRSS